MQMRIIGEEFHDGFVGGVNIFLVAGKRHPAERSLAFAKQRTNIGRHEAGEFKGIAHAIVESLLAQIVAVIENFRARALKSKHGLHMRGHGIHCHLFIFLRVGFAQLICGCHA